MKNALRFMLWFSLLQFFIISCTINTPDPEVTSAPLPTPTTFAFFVQGEDNKVDAKTQPVAVAQIPTVASLFGKPDTPTPKPSATPPPTYPPSKPQITHADTITAPVFDDALNQNWNILEGTGATIDVVSNNRVYNGKYSIAFTPQKDFSTLYFTLQPETGTAYQFNQILGVNLWINGGDDYIQLDQLAIAVIGSNDNSYWVAGDNSVEFPSGESFSETRLYFLDFNHSIPPETWTQLYLPLDMLIYDPEYNYVVGFYLKNDKGFRNTIYIDDVGLVMLPQPEELTPTTPMSPEATVVVTPNNSFTPDIILTEVSILKNELKITTPPKHTATPEPNNCIISPPPHWKIHAVEPGETISGLSVERNVHINIVLNANCLEMDDFLSIGQEIWLPAAPIETPEPPFDEFTSNSPHLYYFPTSSTVLMSNQQYFLNGVQDTC